MPLLREGGSRKQREEQQREQRGEGDGRGFIIERFVEGNMEGFDRPLR